MAQQTVSVSKVFNTPVEVDDPKGKAQFVLIDYGPTGCPEAIDEFAYQVSTKQCLEAVAPTVSITSPENYSVTNSDKVRLKGTVTEISGMLKTLKVNGSPMGASPVSGKPGEYSFAHSVNLVEGGNTFTVLAVNAAGLKGSASVTVNRGTPVSVNLKAFHLTQRGVMHNKTCDIDTPLVAGKSTILRVGVEAKTSSGASSHISQLEMHLWRKSQTGDVLVDTLLGESYNAMYAGFDSPSQMSGIHFWIPGDKLDPAGDYKFTFQAYLGLNKFGQVLTTSCGGSYQTFSETKPIRIFGLPVEAGLYSSALTGTNHLNNVMNALDTVQRTYPVRDGFSTFAYAQKTGVRYTEGSPLQLCDGSQSAKKTNPTLCKGTGFPWKFIDKDSGGQLLRADTEAVTDNSNSSICGKKHTLGGRIKSSSLFARNFNPNLGVYVPGAHPGWEEAKFENPLDQDHDGDIDNADLAHYIAEFYDEQSKTWMTNLNSYNTGETFRFFRDQNGNHCNDRDDEPQADTRTLWNNQQKLYWGPANQAMAAHNKTSGSAYRTDYASLWIPNVLVSGGGFGNIGPGQGKLSALIHGCDSRVIPGSRMSWVTTSED